MKSTLIKECNQKLILKSSGFFILLPLASLKETT
tara:strand:+ start:1232 stop:1333 length:102 start_codon:yes stop_codon:yes gene_type:complete